MRRRHHLAHRFLTACLVGGLATCNCTGSPEPDRADPAPDQAWYRDARATDSRPDRPFEDDGTTGHDEGAEASNAEVGPMDRSSDGPFDRILIDLSEERPPESDGPAEHEQPPAVVAAWRFDDRDDVADEGTWLNRDQILNTSGQRPGDGYVTDPDGDVAAIFNHLDQPGTSSVEVPVDLRGSTGCGFSLRVYPSRSASRHWQVRMVLGDGVQKHWPVVGLEPLAWTEVAVELPAWAAGHASVRLQFLATDSAGDGTGAWVQADGEGTPSLLGTLRIDDIAVVSRSPLDLPDAAAPGDRSQIDAAADRSRIDRRPADGPFDAQPRDHLVPPDRPTENPVPDGAVSDRSVPDGVADRPGFDSSSPDPGSVEDGPALDQPRDRRALDIEVD